MMLFLLQIAVFFSSLAVAAEPVPASVKLACESFSEVQSKVEYCFDNREAVRSARACYEWLLSAWRAEPAMLDPILSKALRKGSETRQEAEFLNSRNDLSKTVRSLDNLLAETRRNTDLVASYFKAMYDTRGIDSPEQTAPCFSENYEKLSRIVWELDDRIIEGQRTRDAAEKMRLISLGRDGNVETDGNLPVILAGRFEEPPARPPVPQGQYRAPASDITGTQEIKRRESPQKDILNSFPARDQLTGP